LASGEVVDSRTSLIPHCAGEEKIDYDLLNAFASDSRKNASKRSVLVELPSDHRERDGKLFDGRIRQETDFNSSSVHLYPSHQHGPKLDIILPSVQNHVSKFNFGSECLPSAQHQFTNYLLPHQSFLVSDVCLVGDVDGLSASNPFDDDEPANNISSMLEAVIATAEPGISPQYALKDVIYIGKTLFHMVPCDLNLAMNNVSSYLKAQAGENVSSYRTAQVICPVSFMQTP